MMYIARVFKNGPYFVHGIESYEEIVPSNGDPVDARPIKRRRRSWRFMSFGLAGAAAISFEPATAIADAKHLLEIDKVEIEERQKRGRLIEHRVT